MKKTLLIPAVAAGLSMFALAANAHEKHTISIGYAQSSMGSDFEKDSKGTNLKYRYEFNDHWGIMGSFTITNQKANGSMSGLGATVNGSQDITYRSWMAGPSYRFNEYVSAYALLGAAEYHDFMTVSTTSRNTYAGIARTTTGSKTTNETAATYSAGLQFNPIPNIAVDVSYERANFDVAKTGTWTIGVGYRF
ncbi:Ail/Lom family outer membrane beta-barrel protein [Xenorhabdus sp. IM139775]|uniref:Ail/Lom family outer membrane beta-barrel protein n=1 Tax=Xenorhabdus sp. IM139775 TaxID=3025876 RepID=UPI002359F09F|nr:Ail/Lom family outer membrane beta-barrel protein [Xenorhabdus sp. IM139775]MDC9593201.1 Ail/Lom family outer membrane beta-barrel protein [Xenorhabdus sp. IM139775]